MAINGSYEHLAEKYRIDISLFERLINNNLPKIFLNNQHRAIAEICWLLKFFYSETIHDKANMIEKIRGIESNIYFINLKNGEENNCSDSKINEI